MPITPEDLLAQAHGLSASKTEPALRGAVSRAYYGAYHAAIRFHDSLPSPGTLPAAGCGVHETLYHQLLNLTGLPPNSPLRLTARQIAYKGKELRKRRVVADYELSATVSEADAQLALEGAKGILELCQRIELQEA